MFSKLARSAGQVAPLVRNAFQIRCLTLTVPRACIASVPNPTVDALVKSHGNQLFEHLNSEKSNEEIIKAQSKDLQSLSLAEQERYCAEIKNRGIPGDLLEIVQQTTAEARAHVSKQKPLPVESLVERHAGQWNSLSSSSLEDAAWLAMLQMAESQALSLGDQQKYLNQVAAKYPQAFGQMADIKSLMEAKDEYAAVANELRKNVLPPEQKIRDILDNKRTEEDLKIFRNHYGANVHYPDIDLNEVSRLFNESKGEALFVQNDGLALMEARNERWQAVHDLYFGKERDTENFPLESITPYNRRLVRYKIIPQHWFDAMYDKTGVSGPHIMLWGSVLYLISKQYLAIGSGPFVVTLLAASILVTGMQHTGAFAGYKKLKLRFSQDKLDYKYTKAKQKELNIRREQIAEAKEIIAGGVKPFVFEAMKENLDLQLEAEYRQRLEEVHNAMKKRLDYQVALVDAKEQFEIQHMINWIIDNVEKSITPQLEKAVMAQCFVDLKALSQKHSAAT